MMDGYPRRLNLVHTQLLFECAIRCISERACRYPCLFWWKCWSFCVAFNIPRDQLVLIHNKTKYNTSKTSQLHAHLWNHVKFCYSLPDLPHYVTLKPVLFNLQSYYSSKRNDSPIIVSLYNICPSV